MMWWEVIKVKFLDDEQRLQIGFSYIMEKLQIITPYGLEEKKKIKPFKKGEKDELILELMSIEIIVNSIKADKDAYERIERLFNQMRDIKSSVKKCSNHKTLDEVELYEIKLFSLLIEELIQIIDRIALRTDSIKFHRLSDIMDILDPEGHKIPTFYIYDSYSLELKNIREEKIKLEREIQLQNNEKVINELKNQRLRLVMLEEEEELNIKKSLTERLSKYADILEKNMKSVGRLDFLIAKARLAMEYNGVKPEICDDTKVCFKGLFNPEIKQVLKEKNKSFTPLSIILDRGTTVITGANMGGKSVALKTITLNLLLGQLGFFVFCDTACFPILDFIYFVSDDMQSISRGLSTFGAEVVRLKEILADIKIQRGFIALDEFARGTNPAEGGYLVKSLCRYLTKFDSISMVSTHYESVTNESKIVLYQVVGLKNIDFDFLEHEIQTNKGYCVEIIQEHMDYRLERVSQGSLIPKDALNICTLLGLEEEVVYMAQDLYEKATKIQEVPGI